MAKTDFDDFVKRQQQLAAAEGEVPFDPVKRKQEWIGHLDALYSEVEKYLKDYVREGSITVRPVKKELNEDLLGGRYEAPSRIIRIGSQEVRLEPIGTMTIASRGRVDVIGRAGTSRLILVDKNVLSAKQLVSVTVVDPDNPSPPEKTARREIEWAWKIMSRPPDLRFTELNKESFLDMLLEVSNG